MKLSLVFSLCWIVATPAAAFDLQGHRGARGLVPENTLAGFAKAIEIRVTTLEMDLALTRDGVLVLAHDPRLNPDLVRDSDGQWLTEPGPAIRSLTFAEMQRYDIGRLNPASRYAAQWTEQVAHDGARFPRLEDVFALAARAAPMVRFNIETKLSPLKPDETADAETFARAVVDAVRAAKVEVRTTVQSFDWRTLVAVRRLAPDIATACLTMETPNANTVASRDGRPSPWLGGIDPASHGNSIAKSAQAAGCATWSPLWRNITAAAVKDARSLGLKVVPWTLNQPADMAAMIDLGVDGLITDYPDRARRLLAEKGISVAR